MKYLILLPVLALAACGSDEVEKPVTFVEPSYKPIEEVIQVSTKAGNLVVLNTPEPVVVEVETPAPEPVVVESIVVEEAAPEPVVVEETAPVIEESVEVSLDTTPEV